MATQSTTVGIQLLAAQQALTSVEAALNTQLVARRRAIRACLCAVLSEHHVVLLGAPGRAKSMLVNRIARSIIDDSTGGPISVFELLMSKFTTPDEMFGPVSVAGLKEDRYVRQIRNKAATKKFWFLDETFKAGSGITNAQLLAMNERQYDDGEGRIDIPLRTIFGASNELPQGDDMSAAWDRYLIRVMVDRLTKLEMRQLYDMPTNQNVQQATILESQLDLLVEHTGRVETTITSAMKDQLCDLRETLELEDSMEISERRWIWANRVLAAHAVLEGRGSVEEDDYAILADVLWSRPNQIKPLERRLSHLANPIIARAVDLGDQAEKVFSLAVDTYNSLIGSDGSKAMSALYDASHKLKAIDEDHMKACLESVVSSGRSTAKVDAIRAAIQKRRMDIMYMVSGKNGVK